MWYVLVCCDNRSFLDLECLDVLLRLYVLVRFDLILFKFVNNVMFFDLIIVFCFVDNYVFILYNMEMGEIVLVDVFEVGFI